MSDARIVHVEPYGSGTDLIVERCEPDKGCAYVTFNGRRVHASQSRLIDMAAALNWAATPESAGAAVSGVVVNPDDLRTVMGGTPNPNYYPALDRLQAALKATREQP